MSGFRQVTKAQARGHLSRDERIARLEGTVLTLDRREEFVEEISRLWRDAQDTFLTIGRYLVQAAERLEHGEYQAMVDNQLPFGYQVSYQLRKVAEAIDGKRLLLEELPPSYATIYQFTTLTDEQLTLARQTEPPLLRPTVKREEIVTFKREMARKVASESPANLPDPAKRVAQLKRRKENLLKQQAAILVELAKIEEELTLVAD
ncbi:hypothetical protein [Magnetospirillum gryphiswaldense]|jgi:hypothetical protein|uniref:Uncharacterized protein n=2 Tax=Magnetospirillum gryphiswaldense TaxID=55518 RepID=V6F4Z9_MAGGM|nr:hypothetical protein [Magnetospirillum gryphiswaldense]AVM72875.1 hypothetical protein MSR1_03610 [Magnetospirillum gryphiswaldense MSR-1]AVM76778.1 hypothetical protein MSR1L_03610 [Magnetospirillum gryphiswaldense]CDK99573.1 conserved protein of unknown function [Magnetospirillum gryphiswaldense MSR-1 v2]